mmetsp:Transcript_18464/g.52989  ORF Transcript_18464/g.52989 Transcript_18464/m.52989 type:complete len:207 (+) Transcript_18464:3706-4326(+)
MRGPLQILSFVLGRATAAVDPDHRAASHPEATLHLLHHESLPGEVGRAVRIVVQHHKLPPKRVGIVPSVVIRPGQKVRIGQLGQSIDGGGIVGAGDEHEQGRAGQKVVRRIGPRPGPIEGVAVPQQPRDGRGRRQGVGRIGRALGRVGHVGRCREGILVEERRLVRGRRSGTGTAGLGPIHGRLRGRSAVAATSAGRYRHSPTHRR